MKIAVIQSNYLPWRGYFDVIHDVDAFIFYDDVQYTLNDWRNRNRLKTANGLVWITIPVGNQNDRRICDVELRDQRWLRKHWMTIEQSYARAPGFAACQGFFRDIYSQAWPSLSELNQTLIRRISREWLGITTPFRDSREFQLSGSGSERLLDLLTQVGAREYISGPAARSYLDADEYQRHGITVRWKDYTTYPPYPQLHGPFEGSVSIVDLLMNCGEKSPYYIWGYRKQNP
jgi:hypothetical protein